MANKIQLDIVTPERIVYTDQVNMVIARTTAGDIGVLPRHAPLIAGLAIWPLRVLKDDAEHQIAVCNGFIEVQPDKVTVLAVCGELPEEIDVKRAQAARMRAEERLKGSRDRIDITRAEAALRRALMRLSVAERNKKL